MNRHPIARSQEWRIYNRGGLISLIDTPLGQVTVASYHPHPHRYPAHKALDFTQLIAGLSGLLIVCGNLNCINPEDRADRTQLIITFRSFSSEPEQAVDQFIDSGKLVFASLGRLGLNDAIPKAGRRNSIPTDLINPDKSSGMRIDHILANGAIEVVAGEVVHSADSNRASDHHPVMLEFSVGRRSDRRPSPPQGVRRKFRLRRFARSWASVTATPSRPPLRRHQTISQTRRSQRSRPPPGGDGDL